MIRGVIFDMDGVLIDSEPAMYKASVRGLADFGISAKEDDFKPYNGTGEQSFFGNVVRQYGGTYTEEMKERIYAYYFRDLEQNIRRFAGVPETVKRLRERGYALAVASASMRRKVEANLRAAGLSPELFRAVITSDDVQRLKPEPDIFLKAAAALSLEPSACLVAEDALSGVRAAKAGGMTCIGITSSLTDARLREAGADFTAPDIRGILQYLELI